MSASGRKRTLPQPVCREVLHVARYGYPLVHRSLPHGANGRLKPRIGNGSNRNPDHSCVLRRSRKYRRATMAAEKAFEASSAVSGPLEPLRLPVNGEEVGRIVSEHTEWGTAPALTGATVTGDHRRRWAGKIDRYTAALTLRSHLCLVAAPQALSAKAWMSATGGKRVGRFRVRSGDNRPCGRDRYTPPIVSKAPQPKNANSASKIASATKGPASVPIGRVGSSILRA